MVKSEKKIEQDRKEIQINRKGFFDKISVICLLVSPLSTSSSQIRE